MPTVGVARRNAVTVTNGPSQPAEGPALPLPHRGQLLLAFLATPHQHMHTAKLGRRRLALRATPLTVKKKTAESCAFAAASHTDPKGPQL